MAERPWRGDDGGLRGESVIQVHRFGMEAATMSRSTGPGQGDIAKRVGQGDSDEAGEDGSSNDPNGTRDDGTVSKR